MNNEVTLVAPENHILICCFVIKINYYKTGQRRSGNYPKDLGTRIVAENGWSSSWADSSRLAGVLAMESVVKGDFSQLPPQDSNTVRIFLSSTFGGTF